MAHLELFCGSAVSDVGRCTHLIFYVLCVCMWCVMYVCDVCVMYVCVYVVCYVCVCICV